MKKCKCGCGNIVKLKRIFIHGHNNRGLTLSESHKRKIAESVKEKWDNDEDYGKSIIKGNTGLKRSIETRKKLSEAHKGEKHSEERRFNQSLSQMRCRTDGYCDAWSDEEYKDDMRKDICQSCGMMELQSLEKWGRRLSLHHDDGNKKDCSPSNLITLCLSCHARFDCFLKWRKEKFTDPTYDKEQPCQHLQI